jgi:hypothetical protein
MDTTEKGSIYDRLLAIHVAIDPDPNPSPGYINTKIWECHRYIEEVERYHIQISRETSVLQQALNNAEAEYQTKKGAMLGLESIRCLPSAAEREAKANQQLKEETEKIKSLKNSVGDLDNLLRAVVLKLKNLNRLNGDIRLQVRILESQIKLNTAPKDDPVTRGLLAEMNKGIAGTDSFMDAESTQDESVTVDPTAPLDVDDLLGSSPETSEPSDPNTLLAPAIDPVTAAEAEAAEAADAVAAEANDADDEGVAEEEEEDPYAIPLEDIPVWSPPSSDEEAPRVDPVVDLDQVIFPDAPQVEAPAPQPISAPVVEETAPTPDPDVNTNQKAVQQKPEALDLDSLLDGLFPKKE